MKILSRIILSFPVLALAACATAPLRDIPLVWEPTAPPDLGKTDLRFASTTAIRFEAFRDTRNQPQLIAENLEDPTPRTVTTSADVGAFVSDHVRRVFGQVGMRTVASGGDVVLSGEVRKFFVEETSTYKGTVSLQLTLASAAGKVLWQGTSTGTAEHFGRSYRSENYYQTLSDAVVNAATALIENARFREALTRARSSGGA